MKKEGSEEEPRVNTLEPYYLQRPGWETGLGRISEDPPSSPSWIPVAGSFGPLERTGVLGEAWREGGGGIPPIVSLYLKNTNSFYADKPGLPRRLTSRGTNMTASRAAHQLQGE